MSIMRKAFVLQCGLWRIIPPDDVMFHHNRKITDAYIQEYLGNQGVKFASDFQEQLSQIIWQKYILTFLQTPYNAFFEYRRTGVPNIPINPKSNRNIPSDKMPLRWMYPSEELITIWIMSQNQLATSMEGRMTIWVSCGF